MFTVNYNCHCGVHVVAAQQQKRAQALCPKVTLPPVLAQ
jgi:hypothetical protein